MEFVHEIVTHINNLDARLINFDSTLIVDPLEGIKHWHRSIEIIYIVEGFQYTEIRGKRIINKPNDMIIINSSDIHACGSHSNSKNLGFLMQLNYKFLRKLYNTDSIYFDETVDTLAFTKMKKIAHILHTIYNKDDLSNYLLVKGYLYQFLYYLEKLLVFNDDKKIISDQNYSNLQNILDYIDDHYSEDLSLQHICDTFNYSVSYVVKTFKKYSNTTFKEYLTHTRLVNGESLLLNSKKSITTIALDLGFSSVKAYNNSFKNLYNITPKEYREKYICTKNNHKTS